MTCLKLRLVSICGYEARVVSAVFSLGHPRSLKAEGAKCQIHIDEYRDLSIPQNFRDMIEEMAASPCGNADTQQKD